MLLFLLACADEASVLAALAPGLNPDAAEALVGGDTFSSWSTHASVADEEAVRFSDGVGLIEEWRTASVSAYPAVEVGEEVRILAAWRDVRTLLWVDRESLFDVIAETVWVDADGRPVRGLEAGVRVTSGTAVWSEGAGLSVGFHGSVVYADVAVSPGLVDQVSVDDSEAAVAAAFAPLVGAVDRVRGGTAFYDDDDGELLTLSGAPDLGVAAAAVLGEDPERGTLVLANLGRDLLVRGWVGPDALDARDSIGFGSSWGCGGCWGGWGQGFMESVSLPRGAVLYASPGGAVLGLTEATVRLGLRARGPEGWVEVEAPTPWGHGALWARDDAWEPTEADTEADIQARELGMDIEIRELDAFGWTVEPG